METANKRLGIALIVCIILLFASNAIWLMYESQFDTYEYSQDGNGVNNINAGEQGDIINGTKIESEEEEKS